MPENHRRQPVLVGNNHNLPATPPNTTEVAKELKICQKNTTTATGTTKTTKNLLDFARNLLKTSRRRHK
jgi:hypothetical protein